MPPSQQGKFRIANFRLKLATQAWRICRLGRRTLSPHRLDSDSSLVVVTRYSTASEATGCRHPIITRTLKTLVECRHPVASLAVLYRVAIMLVSFLTRLTLHTV